MTNEDSAYWEADAITEVTWFSTDFRTAFGTEAQWMGLPRSRRRTCQRVHRGADPESAGLSDA